MTVRVLGLNSAGYNTSASLVVDGEIVFAAEGERLIREKRTRKFPTKGVEAALEAGGIKLEDLDAVADSWNPAVNLEAHSGAQSGRARYLPEAFYSVASNLMALKKPNLARASGQRLEFLEGASVEIHYVTHHEAHAACFFVSPFEQAAILTIDAWGEKECVTFSKGEGNSITKLWSQEFPMSLGSFYSAFTEFLGFQPQSDEWKLMGAAPYGDPDRYYKEFRSLVTLLDGGAFELDLSYFNHYQFHRPLLYTPKLVKLLGVQANGRDQPLTKDHYDVAAATQRVMEDVYFHLLDNLHARTGLDDVVIAGGVAFNSVANGKITKATPFSRSFIPPVPDDSGAGLGAALHVYHRILSHPRQTVMRSNYFGPGFTNTEIGATLVKYKIRHAVVDDPSEAAARLIAAGKIVGWFQGRLEFGDRALGNRSILADPRDPSMKDKVNDTVKYREPFRPFAPSILAERVSEYFVDAEPAPFMERVFPVRKNKRKIIPAVTHVDGSGRLQTVTREQNPLYYRLIEAFERLTGVPVVLNTSFNLKGEAIVCTPTDAISTFYSSGLDALVIGNTVVEK